MPAHSWQAVIVNGDFARSALPYVAKLVAGSAFDPLTDEERLATAREEFEREKWASTNPPPAGTELPFEQ